jgi:regulator of replication initiation timing
MRSTVFLGIALLAGVLSAWAQRPEAAQPTQEDSLRDTLRELQSQLRSLQASVQDLREEAARYRAETRQLRDELATIRGLAPAAASAGVPASSSSPEAASAKGPDSHLAKLQEDVQLLNGKVNEQYQTKVESASKYRVRLSGIALFNLFDNRGNVDSVDNPLLAQPKTAFDSNGSFGGTLRQSILGLEVFGPQLAGARTSGNIQFDFSGGFPATENGTTFGLVRLRTAWARLQWTNTAIIAGQDALFFAPLSPTSFASLSSPPLAYAGNLWAWTPQLRVEHSVPLSDRSSLKFAAGILDGLTGEVPISEYSLQPGAGERSGQPAYAMHLGWTHDVSGQPLAVGVGGYFDHQDWGFHRGVDGWAAITDVQAPLGRWFRISGEFYRGRAVGGLGGGIGQSVVLSGPLSESATRVLGLNSAGGWAQLKFVPRPKLEFNGAWGEDSPSSDDLYWFTGQNYTNMALLRNRAAFVNVIVRPHSNLVFSLEYRRLHTVGLPSSNVEANHVNLAMGVLF